MNYYAARQRQTNGRWDYTVMNDGRAHAIGYCHAYAPFDDKDLNLIFMGNAEWMAKENEKYGQHAGKYHADGHDTPEEACACYRRYLLDHRAKLHTKSKGEAAELHRCAICSEWCANMGEVGHSSHWFLCDEHLTMESLDKLFPEVWECYSSY